MGRGKGKTGCEEGIKGRCGMGGGGVKGRRGMGRGLKGKAEWGWW